MLRVGTDFSGIEAPIQALKKLGIPFVHEFSCDFDKYCVQSIKANYEPKVIFEDITKPRALPPLDIYVAGPPCQSFSLAGKRKGFDDPRGQLIIHSFNAIKQTKPKLFILENVKGMLTVNNKMFFKELQDIISNDLIEYKVFYNVLNTKHYGIPQNRERLFIIGILKTHLKKDFEVPPRVECPFIETYIDRTAVEKKALCASLENKRDKFKNGIFINPFIITPRSSPNKRDYSSTITTDGLYCVPMERYATIGEHFALQGFPKDFKQVVSRTQMIKQIGNSMSVNVLEAIFTECFKCLNLKK